jgi:hypothetical protein
VATAALHADIDALAELVDAVAGRLRSLGEARLGRPPMRVGLGIAEPIRADGPSVADRARGLAQEFVDLVAGLEGRDGPPLPYLPDLAVGDMVAVTGHDLVHILRQSSGNPSAEGIADETCREATAAAKALRADL